MRRIHKAVLATLAGATLLAGCATSPYYDNGYYGGGYGYDYDAAYGGPYYGSPGYVGPSVGFGLGYSYTDRDYRRWHNDNNWRDRDDRNWRDRDNRNGRGDGDRDGRRERRRDDDAARHRFENSQSAGQQDRGGRPEPVEQHDQRG